jgi:hypothetical protein
VRRIGLISATLTLSLLAPASPAHSASDPYCTSSYASPPSHQKRPIRLGIDPGLAGSVGGTQLPSVPDDPKRDLAAVKALRPSRRALVVRLNRMFWSDGQAGIDRFRALANSYTRAGFNVELQVRYHPAAGHAGDFRGWLRYVRKVVDAFGRNRRVTALTITNEVNVQFSPNTSDGYYKGAEDALIAGIEAAHSRALRRHFRQLRLGFTYAYRFAPSGDASFFSYLGAHGGRAFRRALGFVGLDFYPGSVYPPVMAPGDTYPAELGQALGVVRRCLTPKAAIGSGTPIWITENGVPTGTNSETAQAAALGELVQATSQYRRTFNVTDYRWFNLRDSSSGSPANLFGPTFSSDGLLRSNYTQKPAFAVYRNLIAALGTRPWQRPRPNRRHQHKRHNKHHGHERRP